VPGAGLSFGRAPTNDVVLSSDEFPGVSAHHARVTFGGNELFLEDLNSRNGTVVDGTPIARVRLEHGTVFELGVAGPRFVALAGERLDETLTLPRSVAGRSIGTQTMYLLREKLGLPQGENIEQLVQKRSRRSLIVNLSLLLLFGVCIAYFWRNWARRESEAIATRQEETDARLAAALQALEEQRLQWTRQDEKLESARSAWESDRSRLELERGRLEDQIGKLEAAGVSRTDEIARLQQDLEKTSKTLALYDPINLELAQLDQVARFEKSVVLIESTLLFREQASGRVLHITDDGTLNMESSGQPFGEVGSGTGFCISPDGAIVTNAHVVFKDSQYPENIPLNDHEILLAERELWVTFSGSAERRKAKLEKWVRSEREDLALIKIEPFEGMPYLSGFALDSPDPPLGIDVYMIGFPRGKGILQDGDRVLASTFRGIVSRSVDYYLQIDAAVHPGVSGGPVIDRKGNMIGVITAMQIMDADASYSAIGYVIPIHEVAKVWPLEEGPQ
jgi:S1-C subfamily serine protease